MDKKEVFEEFAKNVENELGRDLEKLYLFGSVAKGNYNEESDIDVFVVINSVEKREKVEEIAFDTSVEHGVFIVPIIKTAEEFKDKKDSFFVKEVLETGEAYV